MSKVAVVFWSGTGNTEQMAEAVAEGAKSAGAEVTLANVNDFDSSSVADFDGIAFGCPAMGAEVLEDSEFEPVFNECESALNGKSIALFGSNGWGEGEWMRNWKTPVRVTVQTLFAKALSATALPMTTPLRLAKSLAHHSLNLGCKYSIS